MNSNGSPLVSVVTPVYNGEAYLKECIESVLAQTYPHWEYIIVDNCSTDGTLSVATHYANRDGRIQVHRNSHHLPIIANHNNAFRLIAEHSKYCKQVSADDWIFPECLQKMVELAEAHPSVGIVGSYQLSGYGSDGRNWSVRWDEIPYPSRITSGKEISRNQLLGGPYVFGSPSSLLYRADLVRASDEFFPNSSPHADTSACYKCMQQADFGFVHQVLSYERIHSQATSAACRKVNSYYSSRLSDFDKYGNSFLADREFSRRRAEIVAEYYYFLGISLFHRQGKEFWEYHKCKLLECGELFDRWRIGRAALIKGVDLLLNPKATIEKTLRHMRTRHQ